MFSKEYFQLLGDNKTWDFPNITKHFRKITDSSVFMNNEREKISQHLSHQKYIEINYKDGNKSLCPPGVVWVSNSGRFSCQRLDDFIDAQIFILWDLKRKVFLPVPFHDLDGIDEKNEIIFCRSILPEFSSMDPDMPFRFNAAMIEDISRFSYLKNVHITDDYLYSGHTVISGKENLTGFFNLL